MRAGHPPPLVQCRTGLHLIPAERAALLGANERAGGAVLVAGMGAGRLAWQRLTGPGPQVREPFAPEVVA